MRLKQEVQGDILFDDFSRGRYSTDASIYQLMPVGIVIPASEDDVQIALQIAVEEGVPLLPRGSGTSQNGQAIGEALLIDSTKYINQVIELDNDAITICLHH